MRRNALFQSAFHGAGCRRLISYEEQDFEKGGRGELFCGMPDEEELLMNMQHAIQECMASLHTLVPTISVLCKLPCASAVLSGNLDGLLCTILSCSAKLG